jgi:hypothetical protein
MTPTRRRGAAAKPMLALLALLIMAAAGVFLKFWMQPQTKPDVDVGRRVAEEFLAKLHDGQVGPAWDETTAEFKSIEGRESFIRSAAKAPVLKQELHFVSMQEVQVQKQPRAEYVFQAPDGKMVRVLIGYEAGGWKVDRLTM